MIGLGRMGGNMAKRLEERRHDVKTYDPQVESTAKTLEELRDELSAPRTFWMMVPAGTITEQTFQTLIKIAEPGDVIVDGGNSNFHDSQRRYAEAKEHGVKFVDAGVSGGVWGLANGYCLMVGGEPEPVKTCEPIFLSLAQKGGYAHVGPPGAGHYVKMVHNGIEYGLLQAYAEGYEILASSSKYPELDLHKIAELWQHGSVVRSWLNELAVRAFEKDRNLDKLKGYVADSGEGRWTVAEAIEEDVPAPVITLSLLMRLRSRQEDTFAGKVIAALRNEFGGHAVKGS